MENIYFNTISTKKIIIEPKYLNDKLDDYIYNYLKFKIEGKCIKEGYVKADSLTIIKKSIGALLGSRFTGDITYQVAFSCDICNPMKGNIIECKVRFVNKLGLLCYNGPITIIVGKQFHTNLDDFNKIKEGDTIKIEIIATKFKLNDKEIQVVGKLYSEKSSLKKENKKIVSSDFTPLDSEIDELDNKNAYINNLEDNDGEEDDEEDEEDEDLEDAEEDMDEDIEEDMDEDYDSEGEDKKISIHDPESMNEEYNIDDIEMDDEEEEEDDYQEED
jgi:DNA-directed RNA polymerase subunit E'/Rpb7